MTFTLFGRWQIRVLLLATVGILFIISMAVKSSSSIAAQTLLTLLYLGLFGLGWDFCYHQLQRLRWDGDWNGLLQLGGAVWEGIFLVTVIKIVGLPGIDIANFNLLGFIGFYTSFSLLSSIVAHSLLRILSPYSRFNGGQWF
ncbi:hypothetical protein [Chamaesiphon sp. VAR_48_metabat_135_sub]|uniref:hypothetical protein n=1 Tax=Chamaesiphon sp. VAR_48_metabat_135_sub TaxID=2964699 RepID=UPI00286AE42E|nr:hypothetical protein [Chamaesiphon sp. VAR_48_metabat_135_sub]